MLAEVGFTFLVFGDLGVKLGDALLEDGFGFLVFVVELANLGVMGWELGVLVFLRMSSRPRPS